MKKLICTLLAVTILCPLLVFADDTTVLESYRAQFSETQGTNCFYFCENAAGNVKKLEWNIESNGQKRWVKMDGDRPTAPYIYSTNLTPGGASDFEFMFVSPRRGTVRLQGEIKRPVSIIGDSRFGDGVKLSILKNSRVLWSGSLANDQASVSYDVTASVKNGDKLHFRVNCGQHNYYDTTVWWPKVDYISNEYVKDEYDPSYYQKDNNGMTELEYNEESDCYIANDGVAFISDTAVMPSDKYSVVKRFKILETGRYRVYSSLTSGSDNGFGNIVKVLKNDTEVWRQLIVPGEKSVIDIGVYANKNDYIDVEVGVNEYGGFNRCDWNCDAVKYLGTLFKECDTSSGVTYAVDKEYTLSSFIKNRGSNVTISSKKYVKQPMAYNSSSGRYESAVAGESDYVSETNVAPGVTTDAVIDIKVPKDGNLKLEGNLYIKDGNSDGVLCKIYLNDKLLWSNRVGSERSLRWDDPFDEVYFLNKINAVANVKAGDVLSFTFNKWRDNYGDITDISDVKLKYISGEVMSKTTKWKLKNSTVIDTETKAMHKDGVNSTVNVSVKNGVAYIAKSDVEMVFGDKAEAVLTKYGTNDEIPIRNAAKAAGMSVSWTADRMIILYNGISVLFGYPEASEIKTQLEIGGDLFV